MIKYEESGRARRVSTVDLSFAAFILRLYVALWVLVAMMSNSDPRVQMEGVVI